MNPLVLVLLACGGAPSPAAPTTDPPAASASSTPARALRLHEHHLTDPGLNGMVASTILVPDGWEVEGGVTRPAGAYYKNPVLADVKVTAPDGRGVHFFPTMSFEFGDRIQGPLLQPTLGGHFHLPLPDSVGSFLLQLAQLAPAPGVTNLRVLSEADLPDLTAQLRQGQAAQYQAAQQMNAAAAGIGVSDHFDTQATAVEIAYTFEGRPMRETFVVAWRYYVTQLNGRPIGGTWAILQMRSMRAPEGVDHIDDPVLNAILGSVRLNPAWVQEMQRFWAEIARIEHQGAMQRAADNARHQQVMAQHRSDISDILHQGWKTRSALSDAGHAATVDAIHDRTPYATPQGTTVELPSFYDHVFTDGQGHYLLHDDALHDPNTDPAFSDRTWTRIEPSRR